MSQRWLNPFIQQVDASGLPYSGGTLDFYTSGTTSRLTTYADRALTIANPNPIVLNSRGAPTVAVYLQNTPYKIVLSDSGGNQIWTADPVTADDFDAFPILLVGSGSPTGAVAGTAGSAGTPNILPTFYFDFTNVLYYVCSKTGNAATAQWTGLNPALSTPTPVVLAPQGYLTPTSGVPIITSDSIAATSVLYTPYFGNMIPIYNGTQFTPTAFTELTLTLTASAHSASTIYDVFCFSNSSVLTLFTGPAWSSSAAGSGARGSGAGTTQLSRVGGVLVNAVAIAAGVNGASTYSVAANLATYLGSIFIDSAAGQVTCHRGFGQSRKWGIWNAYNRAPIILQAGDGTASWTYAVATIRSSNNAAANSLTTFTGLAEEEADLLFTQFVDSSQGSTATVSAGIGVNSTTVYSGLNGTLGGGRSDAGTINVSGMVRAENILAPGLGINTINALEKGVASGTNTFHGTSANMLLRAQWRG